MLKSSQRLLTIKDLRKKINWKLASNFFTLEEARDLSFRKLYKLLKYISKIEHLKLKRLELKEIARFLKSDWTQVPASAIKLWDFLKLYFKKSKKEKQNIIIPEHQVMPTSYQVDRFEVMLN